MTEFLKEHLINWLTYIQIITIILGIRYYLKFKQPFVKYFLILFVYSYLNDQFGNFLKHSLKVTSNLILYNVYYMINFMFLFWLYHYFVKTKNFKKVIFIFTFIYVFAIGYELLFLQMNYFKQFQSIAYIVGGIGILLCVLFYFFEVLNSKEIIKVDKKIIFWISIAYFFYYLAFVPFKVEQNFYAISDSHKYLFNIRIIMTLLMNLILIFGFIWSEQEEH